MNGARVLRVWSKEHSTVETRPWITSQSGAAATRSKRTATHLLKSESRKEWGHVRGGERKHMRFLHNWQFFTLLNRIFGEQLVPVQLCVVSGYSSGWQEGLANISDEDLIICCRKSSSITQAGSELDFLFSPRATGRQHKQQNKRAEIDIHSRWGVTSSLLRIVWTQHEQEQVINAGEKEPNEHFRFKTKEHGWLVSDWCFYRFTKLFSTSVLGCFSYCWGFPPHPDLPTSTSVSILSMNWQRICRGFCTAWSYSAALALRTPTECKLTYGNMISGRF